jgi:tetratricopeptide (TPR) repeat protein
MDPMNPRVYHHAARVCVELGRLDQALAHFHAALDLVPDDIEAILGLLRIWIEEERFAEAQRLLADKLESMGPSSDLYLLLGMLYQEARQPMEALRAFQRSAELEPRSASAHFYVGAQLEQLDRPSEARRRLRQAIQLDPNHADALNYLGYMNTDAGVDLGEAKGFIERAVLLDPNNGAYLDSLGWVYFKLGQVERAIQYLEQASQLLDSDPVIFDHLGDAYAKDGQLSKARDAWRKALDLSPGYESVQQKLNSLPRLSHENGQGAAYETGPQGSATVSR